MTADALAAALVPADPSRIAFEWLKDQSWPLWLEYGVDWERRGFRESLDIATLTSPADFRRLRVVARQVYVFSQAHRFGVARAGDAVEVGIDFLSRKARLADGSYAQRFDLDGAITSEVRDLYDHAFVLLALSSAARILPAEPLRVEALNLMAYLDANLRHPVIGYEESLPKAAPRRQNPHMHLLEAVLAAYEVFGEPVFLARAQEMIELFLSRFTHPDEGTLCEFFDDGLSPLLQDGVYVVEPGHHCEWMWLLHWFKSQINGESEFAARLDVALQRLQAFNDRYAINPVTGTLRDEVWQNGVVKGANSRLWPQTERLKSEVLRGDGDVPGVFEALGQYFTHTPRGLWFERLQADGTPVAEPAPASSLYHLTCGILFAHDRLGG